MAYDAGKDYNFDSLQRYIFHQAGASLRTYLTIVDGDLAPLMAGIRGAALNDRQRELIATVRPERRKRLQFPPEYAALLQDVEK